MDLLYLLIFFDHDTSGRAFLIWTLLFLALLRKSINLFRHYAVRKKIIQTNARNMEKKFSKKFDISINKIAKRKEFKQIVTWVSIFIISFLLLIVLDIIEQSNSFRFSSFVLLVAIVSACISVFLILKEIALYLLNLAISGNSDYKAKNTIILIKVIYYVLMMFWGGVFFIFGGIKIERHSNTSLWRYEIGALEIGFLYMSYFLLIIATITLLVILLSIVFNYNIKAQAISERIKFIIFNYSQIVLLLTGLVVCSSILFGDFNSILTELTIKGFFNCLYIVLLSIQDISIVYSEAVSVFGKIVLIICSFCNLLFIGMFIGTFLERE